MALTTTISYAVGSGGATNLANGLTAYVPPGQTLTLAPQVTTGILQWTITIVSDYGPLNMGPLVFNGPLFSLPVPIPQNGCKLTVFSEATDGNNNYQSINFFQTQQLFQHAFSSNSASVSVGSSAAGAVLATLNLAPTATGKYRFTGNVVFTNSANATHSLQLLLQTQSGSSTASTVYTGNLVSLISAVSGGLATVQYELSAGLAVAAAGGSGVVNLLGVADASAAISVVIAQATLVAQEIS